MNALDQYQAEACITAIYPKEANIIYPTLGLVGEAGEVAEKVKKWIRDDITLNKQELAKEIGDVLWYVANLSHDLGYTLSEIANMNIAKLQDRVARGTIRGSGDNR